MISFASAQGNCFNRLGKLGLLIKQMQTYQAAQLTNMTSQSTGVIGQYGSESDLAAIMGDNYLGVLSSPETVASTAQQLAVQTINRVVFRDSPLINQSLTNLNTLGSIKEIIRQMNLAGATVLKMTVTATLGSFTGTGNGVILASTVRPSDGKTLENAFAESVLFTCSSDSYTGGAAAGNEGFTITGQGNQQDLFAFNWPLGSNARSTFSAIDGNASNSAGNILTNSGFTTWTNNVPNKFVLTVGVAGTNIFQETTNTYNTGGAVRLVGDAPGTLTSFNQRFSNSIGTLGSLTPLTQYGVNIFARCGAVAPAAGTLTIDLIDGNGSIIQDANGVNNSFSINLTGLNTVYAAQNGVFRTPANLPSQQYIRLRLSQSLTNGATVYLDKLSMGVMKQIYASGPYVSVHSGSVPFVKGDYGTCTITNSRGAGGTLNTFQTLWCRLLDPLIYANNILLPSSSTPTISDNLIG